MCLLTSGLHLSVQFFKRNECDVSDLLGSGVFLCAAAEGATSDVVPQLFNQFWILLLDLLGELLSTERNVNISQNTVSETLFMWHIKASCYVRNSA